MHKITKGLKKKKKGKKSKHKEEELFKPEELEAYRKEHQQQQATPAAAAATEGAEASTAAAGNEEWKKFIQLTAGVDDILKKTQGDLDRIKSTSFFQRVPTPSEVKKQEEEEARQEEKAPEPEPPKLEPGIVPVSESESEEEDEDDIFDTAYIDAIATGEVKLAYIPESPTEQAEGDDPFDTTIAERAILGPAVERRGKKLVYIGAAVEVLTGRVQAPTCATKRPVSTKRQILKEQNLLLGSFDDNANSIASTATVPDSPPKKTLLDEDEPIPLADEPVDLSKTLHQIPSPASRVEESKTNKNEDILAEFDVIKKKDDEDDDDEFALLAAESLSKTPTAPAPTPVSLTNGTVEELSDWKPFGEAYKETEEASDDPFDTTFADNILPGKAELKVIEEEILNADDVDFNPRASEKFNDSISKVSIQVTDPGGQRESISSLDRISENELNVIKTIHRDLLGGSNTDLASLGDQPLKPAEQIDENYIEYCDPFDTSAICPLPPGQTELKFLEKELLGDIQKETRSSLSDDEFDPRAVEDKPKERTFSRPDVLHVGSGKSVLFDLSPPKDLLDTAEEDIKKASKPLTPYYVRKDSIPEAANEEDPFDTSFVSNAAPGKAELKIIESDLFDPQAELNRCIADDNFNPRDERQAAAAELAQRVQEIYNPKPLKESRTIDLLAVEENVGAKVLTPVAEKPQNFEDFYADPFDTSIASNILPGKTELKLLETELIQTKATDPSQQQDLLHSEDSVIAKPLSPISTSRINSVTEEDDFDPFDTSIASNIAPGKTELKLLESELI